MSHVSHKSSLTSDLLSTTTNQNRNTTNTRTHHVKNQIKPTRLNFQLLNFSSTPLPKPGPNPTPNRTKLSDPYSSIQAARWQVAVLYHQAPTTVAAALGEDRSSCLAACVVRAAANFGGQQSGIKGELLLLCAVVVESGEWRETDEEVRRDPPHSSERERCCDRLVCCCFVFMCGIAFSSKMLSLALLRVALPHSLYWLVLQQVRSLL